MCRFALLFATVVLAAQSLNNAFQGTMIVQEFELKSLRTVTMMGKLERLEPKDARVIP